MRPYRCFTICRAAAFMQRKVPFRLALMTASKSSGFISIRRLSRVIPALFTRMSMRPKVLRAASIRAFTSSSFDTSHRRATALAPRDSQAAAVSLAAASLPA